MSRLLVYIGTFLVWTGLCHGFWMDNDGEVTPSDPFVFIGNNLTLTCNVTKADITGNVSGSMHFVAKIKEDPGEEIIPAKYTHVTGPKSIELVYPVTSPSDGRMYTCILNTSSSYLVPGSQIAIVEYPIAAVDNITCVVSNWKSMNCSWKFQENVVSKEQLKYSLKWTRRPPIAFECKNSGDNWCSWMSLNGSDSFQMNPHHMIVNVTVEDRSGRIRAYNQSAIFIINPFHHVKPDPVEDLAVVNRTSKCLTVTWNFKPQYGFSMEYAVHVGQRNVRTKDMQVEVCDLHPATTFSISVTGMPIPPIDDRPMGYMSEPAVMEISTLEDKPSGAPRVVPGSFFQFGEDRSKDCSENSTSCSVTLFWQGLTEEESNGEITAYRVELEDMTSAGSNEPQRVSGGKRSVSLTMKRSHEYKATFLAGTDVGFSDNSSSLLIPSYANKPSFPRVFVVEDEGSSSLYITWTPAGDENDQYTLYVCSGSWSERLCESEMSWTHVENVISYEMNVHNVSNPLVGISHEVKTSANNVISSGIKWSTCIYKKDKDPDKPKITGVSTQIENSLLVEWEKFGCDLPAVYVDKYILSYCITNNQSCIGQVEQITIDDPTMSKRSYLLGNLVPHKLYNITLRAFSRGRAGPLSAPVVAQVVNNALSPGAITGIVLGVLFFLVLLISVVVICGRYCYKKLEHAKLEIEMPKVSDDEDFPNGDVSAPFSSSDYDAWENETKSTLLSNNNDVEKIKALEMVTSQSSSNKGSSNDSYLKIGRAATTETSSEVDEKPQKQSLVLHSEMQVFTVLQDPRLSARIEKLRNLSSASGKDQPSGIVNSGYITYPDQVQRSLCKVLDGSVSAETGDSKPAMSGDGCGAFTSPESSRVDTSKASVLHADYVTNSQNPSFAKNPPAMVTCSPQIGKVPPADPELIPVNSFPVFSVDTTPSGSSDYVPHSVANSSSQQIKLDIDVSDFDTHIPEEKGSVLTSSCDPSCDEAVTPVRTAEKPLISQSSGYVVLPVAHGVETSSLVSSSADQVDDLSNTEPSGYIPLPDAQVDKASNDEPSNQVPLPGSQVDETSNDEPSSYVHLSGALVERSVNLPGAPVDELSNVEQSGYVHLPGDAVGRTVPLPGAPVDELSNVEPSGYVHLPGAPLDRSVNLPGAQVDETSNVQPSGYVHLLGAQVDKPLLLPGAPVDEPSNVEPSGYITLPGVPSDVRSLSEPVDYVSESRGDKSTTSTSFSGSSIEPSTSDVQPSGYVPLSGVPVQNLTPDLYSGSVTLPVVVTSPEVKPSDTIGPISTVPFARDAVCLRSQENPIKGILDDSCSYGTSFDPANAESTIPGGKDAGDDSSPELSLASSGPLPDETRTVSDASEDKPLNEDYVPKEPDHPDYVPKESLELQPPSPPKQNQTNSYLPVLAIPHSPLSQTARLTPLHSTTSDSSSSSPTSLSDMCSPTHHTPELVQRSISSDSGIEIDFKRPKQKISQLSSPQEQITEEVFNSLSFNQSSVI